MNRRELLSGSFGLAATGILRGGIALAAAPAGPDQKPPFSAEWLRNHARQISERGYREPEKVTLPALTKLDWEAYRRIRFRADRALWHEADVSFRVRMFHVGRDFLYPVAIHEVEDGVARAIAFSPEAFDYDGITFREPLPPAIGFAGFQIFFQSDFEHDMAAFLGASYFRAVDWQMQYGISARGLAVDTALPNGEEFPLFQSFWIERPRARELALTVHALLDSPSMAGAYRFVVRPGRSTVMDVEASLFPRKTVRRLGLAPLTSMYHHGENDRRLIDDFRPEVHDSDGFAILRGDGERLWRPLVNPARLHVNVYGDENPRGFGLLQRDRDFDSYQDSDYRYEKRPNLWIVPHGDWGRGAIYLIEIPSDLEIFDNIVAFWTPERAVEPGRELRFAYTLHWGAEVPDRDSPVGRAVATRTGTGGAPGDRRKRKSRKFVIDFAGGPLALHAEGAAVEPVITASRGEITGAGAVFVPATRSWRAAFDLRADGGDPVDLRCYLRFAGNALTETWTYQWIAAE